MWYALAEAGALTACLFLVSGDVSEKLTHFTWWGILSLITFDLAEAARQWAPAVYNKIYFICLAVALVIMIGVWGLSAMRCAMLRDSLVDYGAAGYFAGNWAIHYWPVIRIAACSRPTVSGKVRLHQTATSGIIFLAYLSLNNASSVYGCHSARTIISGASVAGLAFIYVAEKPFSDYFHRIVNTPPTAPGAPRKSQSRASLRG